jgi:formate hydrogenlyase transcriptional activator
MEVTGPSIEFTKVPRAGEGNALKLVTIEGRVLGAHPGQQIVLFARSGAWWVQPFANKPFTKIQPDSTWTNSTHPGTEYAAILVEPGYGPPGTTFVLPSPGGDVVAVALVEGTPSFWRTWWFRGSGGLALLAMAFGIYRIRIRNFEERELQFRMLAENAPDIVMRFDHDLRYSYVNPIVEDYTGLPPTALLGKTNQEVGIFEKYVQSWEAGLRRVFKTGQAIAEEFTFDTPKGERLFESRLVPENGVDGSTRSVLAITRDITGRKRAEETLRRSEAYLTEAQRLSHSGSWAWDVRTGDAIWSQEMFRILGCNPEKTKPTLSLFLERVHPEDRPRIEQRAKIESTQIERVDSAADYRIVLEDGTIKHLHSVAHPVINESGEVVEIVGTTMDVTASKRAEEGLLVAQSNLKRSNDRLKLLLDLNNAVISNLDLRDLLQAISSSVRQVMQCDSAGVMLPDLENKWLRLYAQDFPDSKGIINEETPIPIEGSHPGKAFLTGKPVVSSGSHDPAGINPEMHRLAAREGMKSICNLPLIRRNRVLGVLRLGRLQEKPFTEDDVEFLTQVASQLALAVENALAYRQIADLKDKLAQENLYLEDEIRNEQGFEEIIGQSEALRTVLRQVETVAPTESTVLIYGDTGTGKELIARAIHDRSSRSSNAFVKLNCAAIPAGLLESELFGHERGAFTGAVTQRIGRFELANHGTVFLDEVGEIPLELQPKLLRVLQEREFERLGSSRTLRTDVRLIAATNRDLAAMVEEQKFRGDLFYRLNVFPLHMPPLSARSEDIPLLVRHFAQQFARQFNKNIQTITTETMNELASYRWPGNIRELQNVVERAVILSTGPVLKVPLTDLKNRPISTTPERLGTLEDAERKHILAVLEETRWVIGGQNGAAVRLGMKRPTLQFRMRKLGISRPTD